MFTPNKEYLQEEVVTSSLVNKSGVYKGKIISFQYFKSKSSNSEYASIEIETDENQTMWTKIIYKKKDGEPFKFGEKLLTDLCFLTQVTPLPDNENKVKAFENKPIGVVVKVSVNNYNDKNRLQWDIQGFFETANEFTAYELANKVMPPVNVEKQRKKYANAQEVIINTEKKEEEEFYKIDNSDIPFL